MPDTADHSPFRPPGLSHCAITMKPSSQPCIPFALLVCLVPRASIVNHPRSVLLGTRSAISFTLLPIPPNLFHPSCSNSPCIVTPRHLMLCCSALTGRFHLPDPPTSARLCTFAVLTYESITLKLGTLLSACAMLLITPFASRHTCFSCTRSHELTRHDQPLSEKSNNFLNKYSEYPKVVPRPICISASTFLQTATQSPTSFFLSPRNSLHPPHSNPPVSGAQPLSLLSITCACAPTGSIV